MNAFGLVRAGLAVGAMAGAAVLGRRAIDKQVETKLLTATEEAVALAEAELDRSARDVLRERLRAFAQTIAVKFLLLGLVVVSFALGLVTEAGLRVFVLLLGLGYIAFDVRELLPKAWPAYRYARSHGFSGRRMVTDFVAAIAFERAYEEVTARLSDKATSRWVALSSFDTDRMSTEVAEAVAEVARTASYDKIRPRVLLFAGCAGALSLLYAGIAFLAATA